MCERETWRPRTVGCGSRREAWRESLAGGEVRESANPVRELFDAAAQGYTLRLTCLGCRRVRVFHAAAVWRHFEQKGWSPWLRDVARHFRCRLCERRSPRLELGHDEPTETSLPMPDRIAWKRALSRRR